MDSLLAAANRKLREQQNRYNAQKEAEKAEIAKRGVNYRYPEIRQNTDDDKLFEMVTYLRSPEGMQIQIPALLGKASKTGVSNLVLKRVLATDDELWELFFHRDFPGYDHSFGDGIATDSRGTQTRRMTRPPEWVGGVNTKGTDPEYDRVPWRRFYMWCVFFERSAMRMVALDIRQKAITYASWPRKKRQEFTSRLGSSAKLGFASETPDGVVSIMSDPELDGFDKHPISMYYARARLDGRDIYIERLSGAVSYTPPQAYIINENANNLMDIAVGWTARTSEQSMAYFRKLIPTNIPEVGGFEPEKLIRMAMAWAFTQSEEGTSRLDSDLSKKLYALLSNMKQLPPVPRVRGRVMFGEDIMFDDVLYVGDQCCANEQCSNEPVGVSIIDGLRYCSKECQPIARASQ